MNTGLKKNKTNKTALSLSAGDVAIENRNWMNVGTFSPFTSPTTPTCKNGITRCCSTFLLGEIFELKAELNSDKKEKKKEAVKKVIASMTVGKDVRCA